MSEHTTVLKWHRDTPDFNYDTYNRDHIIYFGELGKICASASPEFHGNPQCLDPEQAFVMSLSSCHMLTFLAVAAKRGFIVDSYTDEALGIMGKNQTGKMAMTKVELRPVIKFDSGKIPSPEEFAVLHERAHHNCIIANSIASCVEVVVSPTIMDSKKSTIGNTVLL